MKELRGTEWYGEYATLTDEHNDYIQIEYKCNGTGCLYDYALFPGIDLIFMDFTCPDTFHEFRNCNGDWYGYIAFPSSIFIRLCRY